MDQRRLKLHAIFEKMLGTNHVYFQPPPDLRMAYPCIRYSLSGMDPHWGGNKLYVNTARYQVTYIDADPDNSIKYEMVKLPMCTMERSYKSNGLNHYVFDLYF